MTHAIANRHFRKYLAAKNKQHPRTTNYLLAQVTPHPMRHRKPRLVTCSQSHGTVWPLEPTVGAIWAGGSAAAFIGGSGQTPSRQIVHLLQSTKLCHTYCHIKMCNICRPTESCTPVARTMRTPDVLQICANRKVPESPHTGGRLIDAEIDWIEFIYRNTFNQLGLNSVAFC